MGDVSAAVSDDTARPASTSDGAPVRMWSQMPDIMLAKCAEAQALRRAFPNDLSGVYASEELAHAHVLDAEPATSSKPAKRTQAKLSEAREADEVLAWARTNRERLVRAGDERRAETEEQISAACMRVGADEREVLAAAGLVAVEDAVARREAHEAHASAERPDDLDARLEAAATTPELTPGEETAA